MKQNKKHGTAVLIILALIALIIVPVSAETLTGSLGSTDSIYANYVYGGANNFRGEVFHTLYAYNMEYTSGTNTIIFISNSTLGTKPTFTNATKSGNTTTFIAKVGAVQVGSGTIGYQRIFSGAPPVEQYGGYVWVTFNNYNTSGFTGDQTVDLIWSGLDGLAYTQASPATVPPLATGYMVFAVNGWYPEAARGDFIVSRNDISTSDYTATKPGGLGITGNVYKTTGTSQITIYDSILNTPVSSEYTVSSTNFSFNVPRSSIIVSMLTPFGIRYNSSILFAPTVTPTPTPTWTDTDPIPSGYVRTWFRNVNGQAGGSIYNSNLMLRDVQNNTWRNYTADLDGAAYIDTLPNHTIDGYGTATGFYNTSRLGLATYPNGMWDLSLYPVGSLLNPGTGNVNLIITVNDKTTGLKLNSILKVVKPDGSMTVESTGSSGTVTTVVPNASYILVTATKTGYESATKGITTSSLGPDSLQIELTKTTVTPVVTATPLPGQLTPAPTQDPNDPSLHGGDTSPKAQEMMNWLAMNGMDLVQICFLITVLALLGVKFGKR